MQALLAFIDRIDQARLTHEATRTSVRSLRRGDPGESGPLHLINALLRQAIEAGATQVHLLDAPPGTVVEDDGPHARRGRVQARIDGVLPVDESGAPIPDLPPVPELIPEAALPPAWDGASRINILFIGLDERDLEENQGPPRTDSMIVFTIDPVSKTAGMLSIPRDMWVNIPGFGYSRINTAYPSGEGAQLPGGGPELANKTVSQFLGVPIHYYVQVDFNVFTKLVDELISIGGCIYMVPTEKMRLDPVGPGLDKYILTPGGERKLCQGWKVLALMPVTVIMLAYPVL